MPLAAIPARAAARARSAPPAAPATSPAPMAIEALIFDVFGTCVDWRTGVASEVVRFAEGERARHRSPRLRRLLARAYQPAMQRIRSGERGYIDLDVLHRENLDDTLAAFGLSDRFDELEREALNRAWEKLPPWPDVVPGLARLRERYIVAPCSNGSIALMTRLAKFGDLPWDCILGAGVARAYKPDPRTYLASCEALGSRPETSSWSPRTMATSSAARAAGLRTAFRSAPDRARSGTDHRSKGRGGVGNRRRRLARRRETQIMTSNDHDVRLFVLYYPNDLFLDTTLI